MGEIYNYDGTHLTTVRDGETSLTQSADHGATGSGTFAIDDTAGTLAIVGQKDFRYTESSCANTLTFRGYIAQRTYGRNAGTDRSPDVGASRGINVAVEDLNDMLAHRLLDGTDPDRDAETIAERGTWLLGTEDVTFVDNGRCSFPTDITMSAVDYRYRFPGDVLADMSLAAGPGYNYHVQDYGSGAELIFRDDNTSTADSSTLRISNVATDVDSNHTTVGGTKTFAPSVDATLTRDPENVHSRHAVQFADNTVVERRPATATAFNGERGAVSSAADIKNATQASAKAISELWTHHTEDDTIECTIQVPASAVNLVYAGWRIEAKFSHLNTEGYGSFTWFRVLERTVAPVGADAFSYDLRLKLAPQEAQDVPETCSDLYDNTASDTYYPLGSFISDGVVYYWRSGYIVPSVPNPGMVGSWHFAALGAGGPGTIDYAGDCVGNKLILMTVGNGTWTIQTERYGGTTRALYVAVGPTLSTSATIAFINSGDSVEVTIDDTEAGDCIRSVVIGDRGLACGSKWGWSGAEWVAA